MTTLGRPMHMDEGGERLRALFQPNGDRTAHLRSQIVDALTGFLHQSGVCGVRDVRGLAKRFADYRVPPGSGDPERYIETVLSDLLTHSVHVSSPRCLGHMSAAVPGFLRVFGELIFGLNQNLAKHEASRAATVAERQLLAMLHHLVYGFDDRFYAVRAQDPESWLGLCSSGASLANLAALWCARNTCFARRPGAVGVDEAGLARALDDRGADGGVVLGSALLHYSFDKAVDLLGLGRAGLIKLPVDANGALKIAALEAALRDCRRAGQRVVAIVGVAGTTDCGSIDPLCEMAGIAARERVHFHVDAAWGGPLLFSDRLRERLAGIQHADTVTLDGHKQFCLPIGVSVLLLRDGSGDLGGCAVEGSRPALTLLLHAALHVVGRQGYAQLIENHLHRAGRMAQAIGASADFELLASPQTNIVLYRYVPSAWRPAGGLWTAADHERVNALNADVQAEQFAAGRTFVARTTVDSLARYPGIPVVALRAVLGNPLTTDEDLDAVLADQAAIGARLAEARQVQEMDA